MHTSLFSARSIGILAVAALISVSACSRGDAAGDTEAETAAPWAPEQLTSDNEIPGTAIVAAMETRLA